MLNLHYDHHYQKSMYLFCLAVFLLASGSVQGQHSMPIKGITVVAPPYPIGENEMDELLKVNSEWICLVPYGFSNLNSTHVDFNLDNQWWGEKREGIIKCIELAHENGLKVMIKPQVYIHGHWVGDVDYETEDEWVQWQNNYSEFIHFYNDIAQNYNVEMFCIGTEYKVAVKKRPHFWKKLISELRSDYNGALIYSSNWDEYEEVSFWEELDYIGISSYFPLSEIKTPPPRQLQKKWIPIKKKLKMFSKRYNKKIIFTEFGYMSIDGCAGKAWLIEKDIANRYINEKAQANAYDALFSAHWDEDYWGGGFLWKWFPAGMGHEGYPEKDYTPQDKLSQKIITKWYGK